MSLILSKELQPYSQADTIVRISSEEFISGRNLDEKLAKSAQMGFFYLEMPSDCKKLIDEAVDFAHSFYKNPHVKERKFEGFSGYHDREKFQIESLFLECKYWKEQLPEKLLELAPKMHALGIEILKKTLHICGIKKDEQDQISGDVTGNQGDIYFVFNHYRAEKSCEGLPSHRDFGQITVLFINQLGLQAKINGNWMDVPPLEGYFIINFGRALENSINDSKKLTAAWHRVQQVVKDRISLGIVADNSMDSTIYQKNSSGELINSGESFATYVKKSFAEHFPD